MRVEQISARWAVPRDALRPRLEVLVWRFNRLRCMSLAEVAHRLGRAVVMRAQRCGAMAARRVPAADLSSRPRPWIESAPGVQAAPYIQAACRIAEGRLDVFALSGVELGSPPRWNRDPKTGIEAPLEFGKLLDYRDPKRVGDIKYLWEPNRHLHLVTLAQAWALSGDARHFEVLRSHLQSWFDDCPYALGANWSSALEAALRLINWSVAWQLLGGAGSPHFAGEEGARFRARWLDSVYQHAEFVRGHFSLHSSANNHLLGEAAGLYVAALTWPHWPRARRWLAEASELLERQALLQNAPDGVNLEQAVSYQQFSFELLLVSMLAARANARAFPAAVQWRMESMLGYLASIMDAAGNVPMFGDSDDACVLALSQQSGFCRYRSLLATGAVLFNRPEFKAKAGALDDKTRWLLGRDGEAAFDALDASRAKLPVRRTFPVGGYYIMGCSFETPEELRLVVDAGPLGYERIAAHGHADALSFTLSVGGTPFLVDPGTYAYHTEAAWRAYFRGTSAHNTLRIDAVDQSQPGGNFMWTRKARADASLWSSSWDKEEFEGWHDGYLRLRDPVMHRRRIILDKLDRRVLVQDRVEMTGSHTVELFFHCSPACAVEAVPDGYRIVNAGHCLLVRLPQTPGARTQLHRGSLSPISGWVSTAFDRKQPAWTIAWSARLEGEQQLKTEIHC